MPAFVFITELVVCTNSNIDSPSNTVVRRTSFDLRVGHTHTYQKSIRKRTKPFYKHIHTVTGNTDAHSLVRERNSLRNIGPYAAKLSIGKTSRSSEKSEMCVCDFFKACLSRWQVVDRAFWAVR